MRKIRVDKIRDVVSALCIKANTQLREDVLSSLKKAAAAEKNKRAAGILDILLENACIAKKEGIAICQDTGMADVDLEIGQDVRIMGGGLEKAVNDGVRDGYRKGYFRDSVVDPVSRKPKSGNAPAVIYMRITDGQKIKITVSPKGFGCENRSRLKMFRPTASMDDVKEFIVDAVRAAGPNACPPYTVGVGIGGTADYAMRLSKKALNKGIRVQGAASGGRGTPSDIASSVAGYRSLEKELLNKINKLNIGPMGLGGRCTALGVKVLTYPTHIAGLPVAVSIGCHALRSASATI